MPETVITIEGNLTADPELRALPSGVMVSNFTVASTPRIKQGDEWKDGTTLFVQVTAWRELGEGAANTLRRGNSVIVKGKLKQENYTDKEGNKRSAIKLDADAVGLSVRAKREPVNANAGGSSWGGTAPADDAPPF